MFESLEERRLMSGTTLGEVAGAVGAEQVSRDWLKTSYWAPANAEVRPTEEVAFYYNKIAFGYAPTTDGR
jgi:hypothetical protein